MGISRSEPHRVPFLFSPATAMTCPHEANVVVVGADDSEISFTFDALVESEDGGCQVLSNMPALAIVSLPASLPLLPVCCRSPQ